MRKWFVYDTTLRDGLQEHGREISILDAKNFAKKLDALGFTWLEAGFASAGEDQMSRIKELVRLNLKNTKISAFGRTRGKKETVENATDLNAILLSGVKTATIVGKARKRDVINSLKADLQTNLSMVFESIQYLKEKGLEVIFDAEHFFDGLVDNKEYTLKILEVADKAGADWLVLCDTNGASTEQMIKKGIESAKSCCPINKFGFHAHNDRNRAISNSEMAFHCGISHIQGTINGYGERCGNTDLSILIPNLYFDPQAMALKDSKSLEMLTSLAETTAEYLNANLRNNHPWVGSRAGYTEAGMHTSGILRDPTSYIHADLRKVGNKMTFGVSEQSGKSSIAIKAEEFGVALTKEQIEKVAKIHEQKIRLGYNYAGADASLYLLAINALSKKDYKLPYISSWQVKTCNENGKTTTSAKIVANQGKKIAEKRGSGDGPIDSLNIALSQVLKEFYPNLPQYKLTDYRVKIVNPEASTAAKVRVIIEFTDSEESWSTVGAHENIIEASWLALKDGAKYFLLRHNNQRPDF